MSIESTDCWGSTKNMQRLAEATASLYKPPWIATMPRPAQRSRAGASLADKLIDAAETLYAKNGISGASFRQITVEAGTANNYAVQYYFGDQAGLVRAILEKRMPEIERRRAALLAKAKEAGQLRDLRVLIDVLYRPLIEHTDANGERWFALFVLALFTSPIGLGLAAGTENQAPVSAHILDLQAAAAPAVPPVLLRERHRMIVTMILTTVLSPSKAAGKGLDEATIDNALDMATAALSAPISKAVRAKLKQAKPARGR